MWLMSMPGIVSFIVFCALATIASAKISNMVRISFNLSPSCVRFTTGLTQVLNNSYIWGRLLLLCRRDGNWISCLVILNLELQELVHGGECLR